MRFPSFARARRFASRSIMGQAGLWVAGIVSAALLASILLLVPLLAELISTRGALGVATSERPNVDALRVSPAVVDAKFVHYEQCGFLPVVWRLHESRLSGFVERVYTTTPALRTNTGALLTIIGLGVLLSILATMSMFWLEVALERSAQAATARLRREIYAQAHQLGASDLFVRHKLIAIDLFQNEVETLRRGLSLWWRSFPHAACFGVIMLLLASIVNIWLAIATVLLVIVGTRSFNILRLRLSSKANAKARNAELLQARLADHLLQHRLLGNWRSENRSETADFESELHRFEETGVSQRVIGRALRPIILGIVLLGAWLVLLIAGFNVVRESPRLTLADVVLLGSTLLAMLYPLICLEKLVERSPRAEVAAEAIFRYLDRKPTIGQLPGATQLDRISTSIAFDHLTLADLHGRPLLADLTVSIPANIRLAVFASDITTPLAFAGLLSRFCDPAAGQVLVDGHDLRAKKIDSVRDQVLLLLSENLIASGSVLQNITGDDSSFSADDVLAALKRVGASDFVHSLTDGLNTLVGADGMRLSTGQAIQIGLARAALRNPSVLIIEEPEESLDQRTAEQLADAIDVVSTGKTLIILARRLATLRGSQRVLLFHEGRLVADGSHQELLHQSELYRHLNYVRFNEFRGKLD
jgi:ATP-binding cassette, subfamily B, bacterial